jgi:hypothetical protein
MFKRDREIQKCHRDTAARMAGCKAQLRRECDEYASRLQIAEEETDDLIESETAAGHEIVAPVEKAKNLFVREAAAEGDRQKATMVKVADAIAQERLDVIEMEHKGSVARMDEADAAASAEAERQAAAIIAEAEAWGQRAIDEVKQAAAEFGVATARQVSPPTYPPHSFAPDLCKTQKATESFLPSLRIFHSTTQVRDIEEERGSAIATLEADTEVERGTVSDAALAAFQHDSV